MKYFCSLLLVISFPITSYALDQSGNFSSQAERDLFIKDTLTTMAVQMNRQMPMMLDSETQATNVLALDKSINFTYKLINLSSMQVNTRELEKNAMNNLNDLVCKSKSTQLLIDLGVSYVYLYFGNDDRMITRLVIDRYHCVDKNVLHK